MREGCPARARGSGKAASVLHAGYLSAQVRPRAGRSSKKARRKGVRRTDSRSHPHTLPSSSPQKTVSSLGPMQLCDR